MLCLSRLQALSPAGRTGRATPDEPDDPRQSRSPGPCLRTALSGHRRRTHGTSNSLEHEGPIRLNLSGLNSCTTSRFNTTLCCLPHFLSRERHTGNSLFECEIVPCGRFANVVRGMKLTPFDARFQQNEYGSLRRALTATLTFLRYLTRDNSAVQMHVFNRMDTLLAIEGLEAPLAEALMEVYSFEGNLEEICSEEQCTKVARDLTCSGTQSCSSV